MNFKRFFHKKNTLPYPKKKEIKKKRRQEKKRNKKNPNSLTDFFLPNLLLASKRSLSVQVDWLINVHTAFTDTNGRMLAHKQFLLLGDIELDTVINQYVLKIKT